MPHLSSSCAQRGLTTPDHLRVWVTMLARPTCTLGQEPWVAGAQLTHMWAQRATLFPCWSPGEISNMELAWLAVLYVLHLRGRVTCLSQQEEDSRSSALGLAVYSDQSALKNLLVAGRPAISEGVGLVMSRHNLGPQMF